MLKVNLLKEMIAAGYVQHQKHPEKNLWIYNYTPAAQYERFWNEVTIQCRGLILDEEYNFVARPFPKFFNLGELEDQQIPNGSFEVFEKMDGSLGILYWIDEEPFIATRASFTSKQSVVANNILKNKYASILPKLDKNKTYLFEIIYPANRIVLDYGDLKDLVLLAIIDTETGQDHIVDEIGFPIAKKYDGLEDINQLKALALDNKEGFVVKFQNGFRLKVKFEEYVRLHRIITQVSSISVWEYLRTGKNFEEFLVDVPDEFYAWIKKTRSLLTRQFEEIEQQCKAEYKELETRKETAFYFQTCTYPRILFAMLDKKPYAPFIWQLIRPEFQKPFVE